MNKGPATAVGGTQSIERAVALLRILATVNHDGGSAAELATQTRIDRTTAHRMLKCMAAENLLRYSPDSHRYFLGPLAYEIGLAAAEQVKLRTICAGSLARIAAETGDTVFLMERERYESVCIDRAEGGYPVKALVVDVGGRRPLGIGAGSLAILSALQPEEAELAILHNAAVFSDFPDMSVRRVRRQLAEARSTGRVSIGAVGVEGVRAVAVALVTASGRPLGALSVAAIASRMSDERRTQLLKILEREAAVMSVRLS